MCNNYYNVDKTDGNNGSVKDGDDFAGDGNDKEVLPVPPRMTNHKTDMISFVYLVIVLSNMYI